MAASRWQTATPDGGLVLVHEAEQVRVQPGPDWAALAWDDELAGWVSHRPEARFIVRVRELDSPRLDFALDNLFDDVLQFESPRLEFDGNARISGWLAGAVGQVLITSAAGTACYDQVRGQCKQVPGEGRITVAIFGEPMLLAPNQRLDSSWRREWLRSGVVPQEPSWLPPKRFDLVGEPIIFELPDAGFEGEGLSFGSEGDSCAVTGPHGIHEVGVFDAKGRTAVPVGWYDRWPTLISVALSQPELPTDQEAWLRAMAIANPGIRQAIADQLIDNRRTSKHDDQLEGLDLDRLDTLLGHCLQYPTLWGVLGGLVAMSHTELPIAEEVRAAVQQLARQHPTSGAVPIVSLLAMAVAGEVMLPEQLAIPPDTNSKPWRTLAGDDEVMPWQLLADIDFGRVSSRSGTVAASDVALAKLWLATRPDSGFHVELAPAIVTARDTLRARISAEPDSETLCWLLVTEAIPD